MDPKQLLVGPSFMNSCLRQPIIGTRSRVFRASETVPRAAVRGARVRTRGAGTRPPRGRRAPRAAAARRRAPTRTNPDAAARRGAGTRGAPRRSSRRPRGRAPRAPAPGLRIDASWRAADVDRRLPARGLVLDARVRGGAAAVRGAHRRAPGPATDVPRPRAPCRKSPGDSGPTRRAPEGRGRAAWNATTAFLNREQRVNLLPELRSQRGGDHLGVGCPRRRGSSRRAPIAAGDPPEHPPRPRPAPRSRSRAASPRSASRVPRCRSPRPARRRGGCGVSGPAPPGARAARAARWSDAGGARRGDRRASRPRDVRGAASLPGITRGPIGTNFTRARARAHGRP